MPPLIKQTPSLLSLLTRRSLSTTPRAFKWEGRTAEEHPSRQTDHKSVQHEAVKEGAAERENNGSRGAGEESSGVAEKAKEEFPEAPDTIGMQDERGGKMTGDKK